MIAKDQYLTIRGTATGYFMNSGSKFYAYVCMVRSEAEAATYLQQIKKDHPKARHYCTAIRLFPNASIERYQDDGEPSGSAGRPMMGQLIKFNLTNVFAVVVRYFGGTKLGIPGLIEAYKTSMEDALLKAEIIECFVYGMVKLTVPYDQYPSFLNYLKQHDLNIIASSFSDQAFITIGIRKSGLETALLQLLRDFTQLDFTSIEKYAHRLQWQIELLDESQTE